MKTCAHLNNLYNKVMMYGRLDFSKTFWKAVFWQNTGLRKCNIFYTHHPQICEGFIFCFQNKKLI